jgi:hypothetical protein
VKVADGKLTTAQQLANQHGYTVINEVCCVQNND